MEQSYSNRAFRSDTAEESSRCVDTSTNNGANASRDNELTTVEKTSDSTGNDYSQSNPSDVNGNVRSRDIEQSNFDDVNHDVTSKSDISSTSLDPQSNVRGNDSYPTDKNDSHVDTKTVNGNNIVGKLYKPSCAPGSFCSKVGSLLHRRRGLIFATGAAIFFSAENMCMELLSRTLGIFEIGSVMSVFVITMTFVCIFVSKMKYPNQKVQYFSLFVSGLFLAAGLPLALESLKHMEVGDSITIIYTMPIFTGIFSWFILRESLRIVDFLFALLSLCGVVLVARPPFIFGQSDDTPVGENPLLGAMYALGSAVSFALLVVTARKQSLLGLHPVMILFFNSIVVLITNAVVCSILGEWTLPTTVEWGFLVGMGTSDFFAQTLIYMAVVVEAAMLVSIIATSEVILTFLWQFIFLGVVPDWVSAVGAVLIIASCVGMATKKETSPGDGSNDGQINVHSISSGIDNPASTVAMDQ